MSSLQLRGPAHARNSPSRSGTNPRSEAIRNSTHHHRNNSHSSNNSSLMSANSKLSTTGSAGQRRKSCAVPADDETAGPPSTSVVGWVDRLLFVLMVLLICVSLTLPFLAWDDAVREQRDKLNGEFDSVVAEYHQALVGQVETMRSRTLQYALFCEQIRSVESFTSFVMEDNVMSMSFVFGQLVTPADRAQFEAETYAEVSSFIRNTNVSEDAGRTREVQLALLVRNITRTPLGPPAPAADVYLPIRYVAPLYAELIFLDVLADEERARTINMTEAGETSYSRRILVPLYDTGGTGDATFMARVVRSKDDPDTIVGYFGATFTWSAYWPAAQRYTSAASVRVQIFDVTADGPDDYGCLYAPIYDGTCDPSTGVWEHVETSAKPCGESVEAILAQAEDEAGSTIEARTELIGGRKYLAIYSKGPRFDENAPEVSASLLTYLVVLAVLAMLQISVVVYRGSRLMRGLAKSRLAIYNMHMSTKVFFSFITHELRNPLFAVLGTAGALQDKLAERGGDEEEVEMVTSIETASDRMSSIINDVLSMRKLEEGKLELEHVPFSLASVMQEVLTTFRTRAAASAIELSTTVDSDLPQHLIGDDGRLVQIISNLVSNSIKFTPRNGTVIVSAIQLDATDASSHTMATPDHVFVVFKVADTGAGIEPEALPHLFTPYKQANAAISRKHGGTGLGLSIVRMLVECMNGRVEVQSAVGKGTEFTVTIPFDVDHRLHPAIIINSASGACIIPSSKHKAVNATLPGQIPDPAEQTVTVVEPDAGPIVEVQPTRRKHSIKELSGPILVVDDLDMNLRVLKRMIQKALPKIRVHEAHNGKEAVDNVLARRRRRREPYRVILMDIVMPVMDGREAMAELIKHGITTPVIALSGGAEDEELRLNEEAGFVTTALKPLRQSKLLGLFRTYCTDPNE